MNDENLHLMLKIHNENFLDVKSIEDFYTFYEDSRYNIYEEYFENIEEDSLIFAVGNICRLGKKLVDYFEERGEIIDDK